MHTLLMCVCPVGTTAGGQPRLAPLDLGNPAQTSAAAPAPAPASDAYMQLFASHFGPFPVSIFRPLFGNRMLPPLPFSGVSVFVDVDGQVPTKAYFSDTAPAMSPADINGSPPYLGPSNVDRQLVVTSITNIAQAVLRLLQPFYAGQMDVCISAGPNSKPTADCSIAASRYLADAIDKITQVCWPLDL